MTFTLTIDSVPKDVTALVLDRDYKINRSAYGKDYRPSKDTVSFSLRYDQTLALDLLTTTNPVVVSLVDGSTPVFTGIMRPTSELTPKNSSGVIKIDALDNSYKLDLAVSTKVYETDVKVYDPLNTAKSAVNLILIGTGITISATAPSISQVLDNFVLNVDENKEKLVNDLLYFHGYTYDFLPNGEITWRKWINETITPAYEFNDDSIYNIHEDLVLTKDDISENDGVDISYRHLQSIQNAEMYFKDFGPPSTSDYSGGAGYGGTTNLGNPYSFKIHDILRVRLMGESYDVDGSLITWVGSKNQAFTFSAVGQVGAGLRCAQLSLNEAALQVTWQTSISNPGHTSTKLHWIKIVADVIGETAGSKVKSDVYGSNPITIESNFLYTPDAAKDFANGYKKNVVDNPYMVTFGSYTARDVGEMVKVKTVTGGFELIGLILERNFDKDTYVYSYKVRAMATITAATGTPDSEPPSPFPVVNPPVIVGAIPAGQTEPAFGLYAETPSEFNQGLIVRAGGIEHLRITYGVKAPSPVLAEPGSFFNAKRGLRVRVPNGFLVWNPTASAFVFHSDDGTNTARTTTNWGSGAESITNCWSITVGDDGKVYALIKRAATTATWIYNFTDDTPVVVTAWTSTFLGSNSHSVLRFGSYYWLAVDGAVRFERTTTASPGTWTTFNYGTGASSSDEIYSPVMVYNNTSLYVVGNGWNGLTAVVVSADDTILRVIEAGATMTATIPPVATPTGIAVTHDSTTDTLWTFDYTSQSWSSETFVSTTYAGLSYVAGYFCGFKYNSGASKWAFGHYAALSYASTFTEINADITDGDSFTSLQPLYSFIVALTNTNTSHGYSGESMYRWVLDNDTTTIRWYKARMLDYTIETTDLSISSVAYEASLYATLSGSLTLDMGATDLRLFTLSGNTTFTMGTLKKTTLRLVVNHHATTQSTITFNSVYSIGATGPSNKVFTLASGVNKFSVFDIFSDGIRTFVAQGKFYA